MTDGFRIGGLRVAPPADLEEEVTRLTNQEPGRVFPLFESRAKLMMFAAALGFYRQRRHEEPFKRGSSIRLEVFQTAIDDRFIDALAVVEAGNLASLAPERGADRIKVFEEYAYSGLREIVDRCLGAHGDPLMALATLVDDVRAREVGSFAAIDPEVLRSLGA